MSERVRNFFANTGIFLLSAIICFVIAEFAIRIYGPIHKYENSRTWMLSSETFQLDNNGAVRYLPNEIIRSVTVNNGEIESDVDFQTNNLGLIDFADYEYEDVTGKKFYAFVGDSFTAGFHGGEAWVPKLRKDLDDRNIQIYNLGVSGTGFEQFYRLLVSAASQVKITHVVILAISDDVYRTFWYPLTNSSEIRFCPERLLETECKNRPPVAKVIAPTSTKEDIIRMAAAGKRDVDRKGTKKYASPPGNMKEYLKQSELLVFVNRSIRKLTGVDENAHITRYMNSVIKIKRQFPHTQLHLIHLPTSEEVASGKYYVKNLGKRVKELGVKYFPALHECKWSTLMFDGHPNQLGYENVARCVSGYLFVHGEESDLSQSQLTQ